MSDRPEGDFWSRTFDDPRGAKNGCFGLLGSIGVGLCLMVAYCATSEQSQPPTVERPAKPNEIDIVSECDMAVKGRLASPSSFDPASAWDYKDQGSYATVLRKFEATNALGSSIGGTYLCKWDKAGERIASVETIDALGDHTVLR